MMLGQEIAIDLDPKSGPIIQMQKTIAKLRTSAVEIVMNRVSIRIAVRLRSKSLIPESCDQVRVQMRCGMGRDEHALLLCKVGNAKRFGKARVPSRIKLDKFQGSRSQKISNGKSVPLTLAMRQWN